MRIGNILGVDKRIYNTFQSRKKMKNIEENYSNNLKFGAECYTCWKEITKNKL